VGSRTNRKEALVAALDDEPRRCGGARVAENARRDRLESIVEREVLPVGVGDAPRGAFVLLERLEALLLALLGQVQPELEQDRAFVGEHSLEAQDVLDLLVELAALGFAIDPAEHRLVYAGPDEDRSRPSAAARAKNRHRGRPSGRRDRAQRASLDVARIHPLDEVERRPCPRLTRRSG
jgi:hypothetical protein